MFDYSFAHWGAFFTAAFLLNLAPGPDLAFILGHTARGGVRGGAAAMIGVWTGAMGHVFFAAVGLSALVAASATAFAIVKWVGVAYLLWLGVRALRSRESLLLEGSGGGSQAFWSVLRQGALVDLLNPKVAIFFLAFLPQFAEADAGPVWAQLMIHGLLIIVTAAIVETPVVLLGDRLARALRSRRQIATYLDRALGAVLIGLGLRLATSSQN